MQKQSVAARFTHMKAQPCQNFSVSADQNNSAANRSWPTKPRRTIRDRRLLLSGMVVGFVNRNRQTAMFDRELPALSPARENPPAIAGVARRRIMTASRPRPLASAVNEPHDVEVSPPHAVRVMDLKFSQWPGWILFDGQRGVNLDDGGVHVFEGFAGKSAAGLLEQTFGGAQLGVGSALGFMPPALAADFAAVFLKSQLD